MINPVKSVVYAVFMVLTALGVGAANAAAPAKVKDPKGFISPTEFQPKSVEQKVNPKGLISPTEFQPKSVDQKEAPKGIASPVDFQDKPNG